MSLLNYFNVAALLMLLYVFAQLGPMLVLLRRQIGRHNKASYLHLRMAGVLKHALRQLASGYSDDEPDWLEVYRENYGLLEKIEDEIIAARKRNWGMGVKYDDSR